MKKTIFYKGGNVLSYADYGNREGYPVLIQHGLIASISGEHLFDRLIERGARLICIARPGYGESSPYVMENIAEYGEVARALVDALGLAHFDVWGISSGAPYSYALAYKFPDRVRNVFILSGIPALYDDAVRAAWPFPIRTDASIAEMQTLAHDLYFSNLSEDDLMNDDIRDSMMNRGFGIAQDFRIRGMDWGFKLSEVQTKVYMRHSRTDNFLPAEITARLLPNCELEIRENDPHFSQAVVDDFICTTMAPWYEPSRSG